MATIQLSDTDFEQKVLKSQELAIVDFWAPWCGPCKMISPILEKISQEYKGRIKIYKINIDEHQATASKYQVLSIPTLLFFKNGKVTSQAVGAKSESDIKKIVDSFL